MSAVGACCSSAVAGGSQLLIPVSCSVINIETAVNSSSDVVFTGATEFAHYKKSGRPIPDVFKLLAESRHD